MRQPIFINLLQQPVCYDKLEVVYTSFEHNICEILQVYNNAFYNNALEPCDTQLFYTSLYDAHDDDFCTSEDGDVSG